MWRDYDKKKKKNGDNTPGQHSGKRKWVVTGQVPEIGHQQPPLLWSDLGDVVELLQIDFTHTLFTAIMTHGRQLKFVTVNGWQDALTHSSVCYSTYAQTSFPPFSSRSLLIMYVGKGGLGSLNEHLWIFIKIKIDWPVYHQHFDSTNSFPIAVFLQLSLETSVSFMDVPSSAYSATNTIDIIFYRNLLGCSQIEPIDMDGGSWSSIRRLQESIRLSPGQRSLFCRDLIIYSEPESINLLLQWG